MRDPAAFAPLLLCVVAVSGCSRCTAHRDAPDAGPAPPPVVEVSPAPRPWTFSRVRGDAGIALPDRCRLRAPTVRAQVSPDTRFVAEPRALGVLVIADATEAGAHTLAGAGAMTLDPDGISRDPVPLPWVDPSALPRLARAGARWIAAMDRPGSVVLWRGSEAEVVGVGDGFEAADLVCGEDRCALLTTRPRAVSAPGATVWIGSPREPASRWRSVEIAPNAGDSDARPFGVAAFDATTGRATIAILEKNEIAMHEITDGGAREITRLQAAHGALDVIALPRVSAMESASAIDDEGCAHDGKPGVRFVREGSAPVDFNLPAPPSRGSLRALDHGAIAAWIAPVGCGMARRVVYAIVLDEQGSPVGSPVPIGDAAGFAIATKGDDVDLWLSDASSVAWLRARCSPR